jgi:tripartite-type tricarboxylate transporter receptor subunit TctC
MKRKLEILAGAVLFVTMMFAAGCSKPAASSGKNASSPAPAAGAVFTSAGAGKIDPASIVQPKNFPRKDIMLVVPLSAGGAFDLAARQIAANVKELFNVNMAVQNIEGGGGFVGMTQVLTARPDGYNLAFFGVGFLAQISTRAIKLSMDQVDVLTTCTTESQLICVSTKSPYNTFDEFVAGIKANPGKISLASTNTLNSQHVAVRRLSEIIFGQGNYEGVIQVPYPGGARIVADLMGDSIIDAGILKSAEIYSGYKAGQIRPLVVAGPERLNVCPECPTLAELGYPEIPFLSGNVNTTAIFAPAGIDPEVREYIIKIIAAAIQSDKFQEYITSMDATGNPTYGAELDGILEGLVQMYVSWGDTYLKGLQ